MSTLKTTILTGGVLCAALFAQPALAQDHAGNDGHGHADGQAPKTWTEPYALDTCPVSGEELGMMGDSIVKVYDGREVRFCCDGCAEDFEADKKAFFKKIDAKMIKDQARYYPMDTCLIGGDPLFEDGEDIAVQMVYGNRLFRLCCNGCKKDLRADPVAFVEKLDKAVADAQRDDYPLDTCPVSGEKLGGMGDPIETVIAGRLVKLCCDGCGPKIQANPTKYLAKIDKAWQAKGMFMPTADMSKSSHGAMKMDGHGKSDGHGDH